MILAEVDTAVVVPVNVFPLTDDTDFKTRETAIAYNETGMDLVWNFYNPATGATSQTAVTPTTAGDYDWSHNGDAMFKIEIPASGGASINNDTEGFGWFTGVCTGVLPWAGPMIAFVPAHVIGGLVTAADFLQVDSQEIGGTTQTGNDIGADTNEILTDTGTTIPATLAAIAAYIDTEVAAIKAVTDNLPNSGALTSLATLAKLKSYMRLLMRSDAATATDEATALGEINADGGSGAGDYDNTTDSTEAIRNRGDGAWTSASGVGLNLQVAPVIPNEIDLAGTATWRIGLLLIDANDDLPSTAEITPGTISIDRKAIGGTSWSSIVADAACSESAGLIYYDEVFDAGTGYAEGDSIRITFKSQKVTADSNDHEITGSGGAIFYTSIRQTVTAVSDVYHAHIRLTIDEANAQDEYTIAWFKNGVPITAGITSPTIQVINRASGTDLIAEDTMSQIGSTGQYKYDEGSNRITAGEAVVVVCKATIDSGTRYARELVSRDST